MPAVVVEIPDALARIVASDEKIGQNAARLARKVRAAHAAAVRWRRAKVKRRARKTLGASS